MTQDTNGLQAQPAAFHAEGAHTASERLLIAKREVFLLHLLSGQYFIDEAHILQDAQEAGISLMHPNYLVISSRVEDWGTMYARSREETMDVRFIIRNLMEHALPGSCGVCYCGKTAFIVNTAEDYQSDMQALKRCLLELTELLEQEFQLSVSFTVSRVYTSPMKLSDAWEDTELVFEYRDLVAEDFIVSSYEDLTYFHRQPAPESYIELSSRLLACIRQVDFEGIRKVFHELIDSEMSTGHLTVEIFRFRIFGIVDQLLYLMEHLRSSVGNETIDRINPGPRLVRKQPIPQLVQEIDDILDELIALTSQQPCTVFPGWLEQVYSYILGNYLNSELYVSQVADHFHVSSTYCSKLFRERYGVRMFDFIQLRRLETAKSMLTSGLSMKEIAAASGFSSALTMSRAFKRYEGSTPSAYKT